MANILLPFFPFPFVLLTTFRVVAGPLLAPVATRRDETHKGMGNGGGSTRGRDLESQDSSPVHTHTKRFPRKKIPTTTTGGGGNPTKINVFFQGNIGRRRQGGSNTAELCTCATPHNVRGGGDFNHFKMHKKERNRSDLTFLAKTLVISRCDLVPLPSVAPQ